ncbi:USF2 factor, partial [Amia calva]|nr:USF2 factor [Amia calva]
SSGDGTGGDEQAAVAIASVQQATAFADHNIQYQFRTENSGGQVTYRVVQVTDEQLDGQTDAAGAVSVVSTAAFTAVASMHLGVWSWSRQSPELQTECLNGKESDMISNTFSSKGGILSKACDYIRELRQNNQRLQESFKEVERVQVDNELLRQQIEELKNENALLRAQLQQHGIEVVGETSGQ